MGTYRLIDAINAPVTVRVWSNADGHNRPASITLTPGKTYALPENDTLLVSELKDLKAKVRYDATLEEALKACGAEYKVEVCRSCGGRLKKIIYKMLEVVE